MSQSKTLRALKEESDCKDKALKAKGFAGSGCRVSPVVFGPTDEYPLPWRVTSSKEGICDIYSGNKRIVGWLNMREAAQIMSEVSGDE